MSRSERASLVRWGGFFFLANGLILCAIGLRYLTHYPWPSDLIAQIYTIVAFVSHFCVLALAPWVLLVLPLTLLFPSRRVVVPAAVGVAAAGLAALLVDSLVYADDRFHLSALALAILGWRTWSFAALYFAIFLAFCALLAKWSWFPARRARPSAYLAGLVLAPFLTTQALHIWADANYYVPITSFTPYLPLFQPWVAKHLVSRWTGLVDLERTRDESQMQELASAPQGLLQYPLAELRCSAPAPLRNVVLIGVDSMRADASTPHLTPHIAAFSERAIRFHNHYSGGNGTRPGLFSFFYGVPATYWRAFYASQRSPVLIDRFQQAGYQLGIFPGNPPDRIVGLDRTAFRNVPDLVGTRDDAELTRRWKEWMRGRDRKRPFFAFLFFESAPGGCWRVDRKVAAVAADGSPAARVRACYDTALHYADTQVGEVLAQLERERLLDDTIVLITSDHGEEFDENGLGFKGHGSSYSEYQLHTPLAVHWPGRSPTVVARRTSHNDIAPTLLTELLGCANPAADYSSGRSLFSDGQWDWLVAASYTGFAVVEPHRITISSGAYFEVRDWRYQLVADPRLDHDVISQAIRETSRFYRP